MGVQYSKAKIENCGENGKLEYICSNKSELLMIDSAETFFELSDRNKELLREMWATLKKDIQEVGVITFVR